MTTKAQQRATLRRKEAKILYTQKNLPFAEIAAHMSVQKATVQKWYALDRTLGIDWDKEKKFLHIKGFDQHIATVLDDYLIAHKQVMQDLKNDTAIDAMTKTRMLASLADTFAKTTKAASKISPEVNHIAAGQEMLTRLTQYIIHHHKDKATNFAEILENFGHYLSQNGTP